LLHGCLRGGSFRWQFPLSAATTMCEEIPTDWLPLLRRLTQLSPDWAVWKNADSALRGQGDIDSVSVRAEREALIREFRSWARENALGPVFTCTHVPGVVLVVALRDREFVELDLCERAVFRGSPLFGAADLRHLMIMDDRGFRRLRPGAEGLLLLFFLGMKYGGRPARGVLQRKGITDLLDSDAEGVKGATALFGAAMKPAARLASAVLGDAWDRQSALQVEAWAAARTLRYPHVAKSRAAFRLSRGRNCLIWPILRRGRRIEGDVDAWLSVANQTYARFGSV
jgi:hypothetical protein